MRANKTQKNKGVIFVAIFLILILAGIAVYVSTNSKSKDLSDKPESFQNSQNQNTNVDSFKEEPEDFSKFRVYLSIADSPSDKFISKSYKDVSSIKVDTLILNAPKNNVNCILDTYSLQGVEVHKLNNYSFSVNQNSSKGNTFNLGSGTFRVEVNCDFEGKKYSDIYTVQILISKSVTAPVSYNN